MGPTLATTIDGPPCSPNTRQVPYRGCWGKLDGDKMTFPTDPRVEQP